MYKLEWPGSQFGPSRVTFEGSFEAEVDRLLSWKGLGLDAGPRVSSGRWPLRVSNMHMEINIYNVPIATTP
jgi:hypothetical protein